jgi:hypothetical protein
MLHLLPKKLKQLELACFVVWVRTYTCFSSHLTSSRQAMRGSLGVSAWSFLLGKGGSERIVEGREAGEWNGSVSECAGVRKSPSPPPVSNKRQVSNVFCSRLQCAWFFPPLCFLSPHWKDSSNHLVQMAQDSISFA